MILLAAGSIYWSLNITANEGFWPFTGRVPQAGLSPVDCWFGDDLPSAECYRMWVPETHGLPESRLINFPVVIFRSDEAREKRPPVLHLGAGGPGAPMYLDYRGGIESLLHEFSRLTLQLGRDLIVIDPRGTGLAEPLLACRFFVVNERDRLRRQQTSRDYMREAAADDEACVDEFLAQGVDFSAYHSLSVAQDIEALRKAAGIERWVLFGVSYAANYALNIADLYPENIESMVLDSAYISKIGLHEYFLESVVKPFRLLFDYCDVDPECTQPLADMEDRFWALRQDLDSNPLEVVVEAEDGERVEVLLDGRRFIDVIMFAIYDPRIFSDIPRVIAGLERGDFSSIEPYLEGYVYYMLDPVWGDISQMAHYCNEQKPAIDFARLGALLDQLPAGFIREDARLGLEWPDQCDRMRIVASAREPVPSRKLAIPTLFLHGQLDVITPVANVRKISRHFSEYHLLLLDSGHGVLGSAACADNATAAFLFYPIVTSEQLYSYCGLSG